MSTHVALLRAVNVGGRGKVPMARLREVFEELGHREVRTYIQSGNVVFDADGTPSPGSLEAAISAAFDLAVTVIVRTPAGLREIVGANPFPEEDPSSLHVGFLAHPAPAGALPGADLERFAPDAAVLRGTELYLHLPNGLGRSKLAEYVTRKPPAPMTVRNWRTVTTLVEISGG
ncbi:MAG: DUF1697 domain-containing protein [Actinobacteria bacterium]|nr:DUF1697 domain-containing protein [Actinomycetota bacterium]